ncbi:hypothetical protein P4H61_16245 [Paenibacillus peoriae]|uniref:competence protein CoiA family protein n=1 Tax=Paenibacillus peoriae TaxID=59893 RepID=UPI00026C5C84|nr:competence protein [Paenibacillus peoriae]MEC0183037.1 hypothetical protein [Paenibacillus peoriae]
MEWALDANKQHVHASSPEAIRGISYICPRCKKDTFLRKGKKRVPHFAHVSGQTNINCELYIPPAIYATQMGEKISVDAVSERSLDIYLDLVKDSWSLDIKIPSAIGQYEGSAFLKFPFAWEGERTIPLSSIRTNGKRIRIRLQTRDYRVLVSGDVRNEWKMKVEYPIKGIDKIIPTAFYYSRLGGRRLTENIPLQWGETYVLVWDNHEIKILHGMPPMLAFRKLQDQNNWSVMIVKLPVSYNKSVEQWIKRFLNRSITFPLPEVKLVTPIPERMIDQEIAVISSTARVVIAVVGAEGAKKWSTIYVQNLDEKQEIRHLGNGEIPVLLSIGKLPLGRTDIWLDDDRESALRLVCQDTIKLIPKINGVVFQGVNLADIEETYSLHSTEAIEFFRKIQEYKFTLTDVYLPNGVSLTIKLFGNQLNEMIVSNENSTEIASILNKLLGQDKHVYLDAGGFGNVEILPIALINANKLSMSPRWREQMRWILITLKTMNHKEIMIKNDNMKKVDMMKINHFNKLDQDLLLNFSKIRFIPKSMLPYVKASINEYIRKSVKKY